MNEDIQDDLWRHFAPLWADLRQVAPRVLLAGGYGLFLKQQWLISKMRFLGEPDGGLIVTPEGGKLVVGNVRTLVEIHQWIEQTPRVTKDFDFIVSLDLIASAEEQRRLDEILERHDFVVVQENARWQFEKAIGKEQKVILDFHSPVPANKQDHLRVDLRRVKPKPSLGETGVHGHANPEAEGFELCPFSFKFNGLEILLPNPVTLAVMKLTAMRDKWRVSQNDLESAKVRDEESRQARKHAEDVFRIAAMMTRQENDTASEVLKAIHASTSYSTAASIFSQFFKTSENWGWQVVEAKWQPEDFQIIRKMLAEWFAPSG